jgi:hypothetical protein
MPFLEVQILQIQFLLKNLMILSKKKLISAQKLLKRKFNEDFFQKKA